MSDRSAPSYAALIEQLEQAKALRKQAEEERNREATLRRQAEDESHREATLRRQAEDESHREATLRRQAEELNRQTTFDEYIAACHTLLSQPLRVAPPARSTKGGIGSPTGKYCPTKLCEWTSLPIQQLEIYNTVRRHLQPAGLDSPRLFPSTIELQGIGRNLCLQPISSEKDLEFVEKLGKERQIQDIFSALCKIPSARQELRLGRGLHFDSHSNALDDDDASMEETTHRRMRPDQFCAHRLDGNSSTLLITAEYKPPHKLSVENLCAGLRPMDLWEEVVNSETVPTDGPDKLRFNAARLTGSVLAQEYHVMIQEGLAYSYVSTGIALVLLHVPEGDPTTLYYYLCVPNKDIPADGEQCLEQPLTAIGRLLCLCLMSCATPLRSNAWRNRVQNSVHVWQTDFEHTRSQIPNEQLQETPPGSEYVPSSPPVSAYGGVRRRSTRLNPGCTPPGVNSDHNDSSDHSDSDLDTAEPHRKRNHSAVASSPPQPQVRSSRPFQSGEEGQTRQTAPNFCTQRCLSGLQRGGLLDQACPNVSVHRRGEQTDRHLVTAAEMVLLLRKQLDIDVDRHCDPFGSCGASGAAFRLHCESYGYTIVGKGTTSRLWSTVLREAHFYQILRSAQGSAVPVFLGSIDLKQTYFLHGAGEIRHMLLMAWGGTPFTEPQWEDMSSTTRKALKKSCAEIRRLGVRHGDVRPENVLWNSELNRVLLIDFHKSELIKTQAGSLKRNALPCDAGTRRRLAT
jgi:hypothetical protein